MQLTFGDAEGMGKRKRTRREIFLAEMEQAGEIKIVGAMYAMETGEVEFLTA